MTDERLPAFTPIVPKPAALTPKEYGKMLAQMGIQHAHLPSGEAALFRNRAERRAAQKRGKR
jgi:hypothetical protein